MTSAEKIKELEGEMFLINHELNKWKDQDKALRETINNDEKIISELQDQMKLRRDFGKFNLNNLKIKYTTFRSTHNGKLLHSYRSLHFN